MGTAAVEDPDLVAPVAARQPVALGLDVRGREVSIKGWTEGAGLDIADALHRLADSGAERRRGHPDPTARACSAAPTTTDSPSCSAYVLDVIASGGVGELAHLRALDPIEHAGRHLAGAIVGTAIYEGRVDVAEAVRALTAAPANWQPLRTGTGSRCVPARRVA